MKYFYDNMLLTEYCEKHNISYSKILLRIERHNLSVEEAMKFEDCRKFPKYDLTGKKFNMLNVLEYIGNSKWKCKCDCGNIVNISTNSLVRRGVKSCGCYKPNKVRFCDSKRFVHIYDGMIRRCCNENDAKYSNYGGRDIKVCDSWEEDFMNFKDDMYESYIEHVQKYGEKNTTIDRIDVNGNYCKENCRWATIKEQARNKQDTVYYNGIPLTKYCEETGINYKTIMSRVYRNNISVEDAVSESIIN